MPLTLYGGNLKIHILSFVINEDCSLSASQGDRGSQGKGGNAPKGCLFLVSIHCKIEEKTICVLLLLFRPLKSGSGSAFYFQVAPNNG